MSDEIRSLSESPRRGWSQTCKGGSKISLFKFIVTLEVSFQVRENIITNLSCRLLWFLSLQFTEPWIRSKCYLRRDESWVIVPDVNVVLVLPPGSVVTLHHVRGSLTEVVLVLSHLPLGSSFEVFFYRTMQNVTYFVQVSLDHCR